MTIKSLWAFVMLVCCVTLVGCSDERDKFIGTWNNGGTGNLVISKQGSGLLFQTEIAATGKTIMSNNARIVEDRLTVDESQIFKNVAYSEKDDGLMVLNIGENVPIYHRMKKRD